MLSNVAEDTVAIMGEPLEGILRETLLINPIAFPESVELLLPPLANTVIMLGAFLSKLVIELGVNKNTDVDQKRCSINNFRTRTSVLNLQGQT